MQPMLLQPELHNGDGMSREEFLWRWERIPELKHAELIKGAVYLASPVSVAHGTYDVAMGGWLNHYAYASGEDLMIAANTTLLLPDGSSLQPDIAVLRERVPPVDSKYFEQIPDLVAEISYSSQSSDLGPKLGAYRAAGLREHITVLLQEQRVEWRAMSVTRYRPLHPSKDGILRSPNFDGLWLDTQALFPVDRRRLFATVDRGVERSSLK